MPNQSYYPAREGDQLTWLFEEISRWRAAAVGIRRHRTTPRAIYRVTDHQVGQWSPEVSVNIGG